ncbi:hypothetical protein MMC28_007464 [Mycoblastus sanguinarius]|nr:hypothetical protein [Mycoblastus sanguinarius]
MPASLPFSKSFDFASGATAERFKNPFWKIKELVFGAPFRRAVSEVKSFGTRIVSAAVRKREYQYQHAGDDRITSDDPLQKNLIDSLLDHIDDHQVVADAAMNYLSAGMFVRHNICWPSLTNSLGRDTTAQSLTWTLYLLMRHPRAQQKIFSELQATLAHTDHQLSLSFDSVQPTSLPYTAAIFNESLRFYPPVPVELKECTSDTTFPDGTWLPKGSLVIWAPWSMGRSKHIWGDDADEFRPERWLITTCEGETPALITMSSFAFPVFNGGPRSCLGKRMAELLAVYVIASLIWKFKFEEVFDEKPKTGEIPKSRLSQNSLTLPMEAGLPCYVHRRQIR